MGAPRAETWQQRRADLLELEIDAINALLLQAKRCVGIWGHGTAMDRLLNQLLDQGALEIENRDTQIAKLREEYDQQVVGVTASGTVITEGKIRELAAEAERGYDPATLRELTPHERDQLRRKASHVTAAPEEEDQH